jgi:hypothetical protein
MEREEHAFSTLQDWECEQLGIPRVPEGAWRAAHYRTEARLRKKLDAYGKKMPKDLLDDQVLREMEEAEVVRQWLPLLTIAMELPAAELFLKLRRGEINAMGKMLPVGAEIIDFVEQYKSYGRSDFDDLVDSPIPQDHWTMPGIDWLSNALIAKGERYCDVSMSVEVLMGLFPGEREPITSAEFVGNCVLIKEPADGNTRSLPRKARGRPPTFAWEAFHVEVAELIKSGRMPRKKEAAIQHMVSWFASTQTGQAPSRSAVSEKLTPYYRRFFSDKNENSMEPP